MRVLTVLPQVERYTEAHGGAIATVVRKTTDVLIGWGHKVDIVGPCDDSSRPYASGDFLPVEFSPTDRSLPIRRAIGLHRRLRGYDFHMHGLYLRGVKHAIRSLPQAPDVVIFHNDMALGPLLERWLPGVPTIHWLHNDIRTRLRRASQAAAAPHGYIAVSSYVARQFRRRYGVPEAKISVALNGVDSREFAPPDDDQSPSRVRFIFAGRIDPDKGVHVLLRAAKELQAEGKEFDLTLVGSPWWWGNHHEHPYLTQTVLPLVSETDSRWIPHQGRGEMPALMCGADVVVVPSIFPDPCPLVVLEAFAAGRAVVASNTGGIPEQALDAAVLTEAGSVEGIASAMRDLINNPGIVRDLKRRSRARALQLPWDRTAAVLLQAIERAGVAAASLPGK